MKKYSISFFITFLVVGCFVFIQCNKNIIKQAVPITGTWKWVYTYKINPLSPTNPATPTNTGIQETLTFYSNNTWKQIQNSVTIDSGNYFIGHGYNYIRGDSCVTLDSLGNIHFVPCKPDTSEYDSISFYKNGNRAGWDSYEILHNDTLVFIPYLSRRFSSYLLPYNGSKWYIKQ